MGTVTSWQSDVPDLEEESAGPVDQLSPAQRKTHGCALDPHVVSPTPAPGKGTRREEGHVPGRRGGGGSMQDLRPVTGRLGA